MNLLDENELLTVLDAKEKRLKHFKERELTRTQAEVAQLENEVSALRGLKYQLNVAKQVFN